MNRFHCTLPESPTALIVKINLCFGRYCSLHLSLRKLILSTNTSCSSKLSLQSAHTCINVAIAVCPKGRGTKPETGGWRFIFDNRFFETSTGFGTCNLLVLRSWPLSKHLPLGSSTSYSTVLVSVAVPLSVSANHEISLALLFSVKPCGFICWPYLRGTG